MGWQQNDTDGTEDVLDLGFNTDDVTPESRSFDVIPKSWQPIMVTGAQVAKSKSSEARYVKLEVTVTDGAFKGRKVFSNHTILNKDGTPNSIGRSQLTELFRACGVGGSNLADLLNAQAIVEGRVGIEKGQGEYGDKNKLEGFRALGSQPASKPVDPNRAAYQKGMEAAQSNLAAQSANRPAFLNRK